MGLAPRGRATFAGVPASDAESPTSDSESLSPQFVRCFCVMAWARSGRRGASPSAGAGVSSSSRIFASVVGFLETAEQGPGVSSSESSESAPQRWRCASVIFDGVVLGRPGFSSAASEKSGETTDALGVAPLLATAADGVTA